MKGRVSIVLLHYNQQDYIKEALKSIFGQNHKDIELIIADDATKDFDVKELQNIVKNTIKTISVLFGK